MSCVGDFLQGSDCDGNKKEIRLQRDEAAMNADSEVAGFAPFSVSTSKD